MFRGQFDPSANLLRILEKCKLVWNVQWTSEEQAKELQETLAMTPEERKAAALEKARQRKLAQAR
jgi:exoribonuclease R